MKKEKLVEPLACDSFFFQRQPVERQFPDDPDQWDGGIQRLEKSGGQQVRAGADCRIADAGFAGQAGIGIGCIGRIAFVTHQDMADPVVAA